MKIAYVVSLFPKLSETFILRELIELRNRGYDLTIVSLKSEREAITPPEARDLLPRTLYARSALQLAASLESYLLRPLELLCIAWRIAASHRGHPVILFKSLALIPGALFFANQLRRRGVEHVHAHWATYPAMVAWIISRLNRIPYSVTGHAHDLFLPNPMLPRKVQDSRFFATISEFNRALLIQRCGPEALPKVRLIRCGLPLGDFRFRQQPRRNEPPVVVSVGRLVDYKGFDVLIRACGRLRDRGRPIRCVIVGDGPERRRLERLTEELDLPGAVSLMGGKRQEEVLRLLGEADQFVLASVPGRDGQQDGIPIVLMEAMALGVPVVSTKLSGIPELVVENRTGLLVRPGDDEQLAAAIERLLLDPALADKLRRSARELVEKEYDLEHSVDLLCAEFGRVAGAGAGAEA